MNPSRIMVLKMFTHRNRYAIANTRQETMEIGWCVPVISNNTNRTSASETSPCYVSGLKYTHSQQIIREDPCDFCMCLDGEVFCWWQQQCVNSSSVTTTTETYNTSTVADSLGVDWSEDPAGGSSSAQETNSNTTAQTSTEQPLSPTVCTVMGVEYKLGEILPRETGTCLQCQCGREARVTCSPIDCTPANQDQFRQQSLDMFDVDVF